MILIIPIVCSIIYKWHFSTFLLLIIVRAFLDCLDGSVARSCDKKTTLGAYLDSVGDSIALFAFLCAFLYVYIKDKGVHTAHNIYVYCIFAVALFSIVYLNNKVHNKIGFNAIEKVLHDNYTLFNIGLATVAWFFINPHKSKNRYSIRLF